MYSDHRTHFQYKQGHTSNKRIQHWAPTLSAYSYNIVFNPGSRHENADAFSRLPVPIPDDCAQPLLPPDLIFLFQAIGTSPVTAKQIRLHHDPLLSQVRNCIIKGWQLPQTEEMRPYKTTTNELSVQNGCLLWGNRSSPTWPSEGYDRVT